ncbi:MAG: hypothetical protein DWQ05_12810 [Calditrichaeota bacterium]|nr:MAG: hypothetical protein DWQ05_12810 [Calditrichota bacterium]
MKSHFKILCLLLFTFELHAAVFVQSNTTPLVSGQRVRVKKLTRDMAGVRSAIVTGGPSIFQDAKQVEAKKQRLQQFRDALMRYPQVMDPDVKAARSEFDALRQALAAEFKRAGDQLSKIGNVQQAMATMEKNSKTYAVPAHLSIPFTETQAKAWVQAAGNARTVAEHNQKQLALIAQMAYLPRNIGTPQSGAPYDDQDVSRLQRNAATMLNLVQSSYEKISGDLKSHMQQMESDVFSRWQEDPSGEKKWLFIQDGSAIEARELFTRSRAIAQSSVYLERALNREPQLALATLAKIEKAEQAFEHNTKSALSSSRLPAPKSTDQARIEIAKKILMNPKYKFGEYGTIVLTTENIVPRERKDSELEIDNAELTLSGNLKMSGTETTWTYKWDEFKFAVPLKEQNSGQWHIWWITAKKFSSGGPNTPINTWISGKATKGNPIPRGNF